MQPRDPAVREAITVGLMVILIVTLASLCAPAREASTPPRMVHLEGVRKVILGHDEGAHGYKGAPGAISIGVDNCSLSVHVEGTDAYDAVAIILIGVYDDGIHKWVGIGGAHSIRTEDWHSFTHWESYHFEILVDRSGVEAVECPQGMYKFKAWAYAKFKVVHETWWGLRRRCWYDVYDLQVSRMIPKDEFG